MATKQATDVSADLKELTTLVEESMADHHVPGISIGLLVDGQPHVLPFGITNAAYPSPVREDTLFQIGSTTKTFTGTLIMRLVEEGKIDLDAPVRTYVPDFAVVDEAASSGATVRHLLTHTGGWIGDFFIDTGRGEDSLSQYVSRMAPLKQVTPVGEVWSYNNAGFSLAGRVIEAVTGQTYESAAKEMILDPVGMKDSVFFPEEAMVRSFAVGHNVLEGEAKVATPWPIPRNSNSAGGIASTAGDQLLWAQLHIHDGKAQDGTPIISAKSARLMQTPAVPAIEGGHMGFTWFLRDVDGVRIVQHGGGTNGQISTFFFAPERDFAMTVLTNAGAGSAVAEVAGKWALKRFLGVADPEHEPKDRAHDELGVYIGRYVAGMTAVEFSAGEGKLVGQLEYLGTIPGAEMPPPPPPITFGFYGDDMIVATSGDAKGMTAEFMRSSDGAIAWMRLGARIHVKET